MTKVSPSHKTKYMRKTRILSWRIGIFRLFIEKHEWVDRIVAIANGKKVFLTNLAKGFKKGRK